MNDPSPPQFQWTIKGTYATWNLIIIAEPPDRPAPSELTEFPEAAFTNLTRYFADTINLYEATRDHDHGP